MAGADQGKRLANVLSSLPMDTLIATPLVKACEAQRQLAEVTKEFILDMGLNNVGTEELPKYEAVDVKFTAKKGNKNIEITAPILSMVNVPSLQIQDVYIDFDCEVDMMDVQTSQVQSATSTDFSNNFKTSASFKAGWLWGKARVNTSYESAYKVKTSLSTKNTSSSTMNTKAKYSFHIKAKNEHPAGLEKLLDILHDCVVENDENSDEEETTTVAE